LDSPFLKRNKPSYHIVFEYIDENLRCSIERMRTSCKTTPMTPFGTTAEPTATLPISKILL